MTAAARSFRGSGGVAVSGLFDDHGDEPDVLRVTCVPSRR